MFDFIETKLAVGYFKYIKMQKPTIKRSTLKKQGYGTQFTRYFLKVRNGQEVLYFGNPFWNIYRITSKVGTEDYVTHRVTN